MYEPPPSVDGILLQQPEQMQLSAFYSVLNPSLRQEPVVPSASHSR